MQGPSSSSPVICAKKTEDYHSGFPVGCADTAVENVRRGSNIYEVNTWLWQFGRGNPRLGGLTVEETADQQQTGRKLPAKNGPSVGERLVSVAREIMSDWKLSTSVIYVRMYVYVCIL